MDTQITTPSKSHTPAQMGRWLLQDQIAEGAATLVYRVICSDTQQDGVLKVFKAYADGHTLLQNEVQALELIHPNLPVLLDSGVSADGRYFLVTEYIQGPNLKEVLGRMGTLPPKDAVTIIERLASALDLAHSAGILHRDLKPSNIIIPDQMGLEGVALLDFSLAGTLEAQSQQTRAGEFFGTPNYMSPEQLQSAPQTRATDIWGLGILLYEMVVGETPFQRDNIAGTVYAIAGDIPELSADDPWELNNIILRCLAKKPEERFTSARDLAKELTIWLDRRTPFRAAMPPMPAAAPMGRPRESIEYASPPMGSVPEFFEERDATSSFAPLPEMQPSKSGRSGWFIFGMVMIALLVAGVIGAGAMVMYTSAATPGAVVTPPKPPLPSHFPGWAYLIPFAVAAAIWLLIRKTLGGKPQEQTPGRVFQDLASGDRRQALIGEMGIALDRLIAQSQGDASAQLMALSVGVAVQDYQEKREAGNESAGLDNAVKLLELIGNRFPNTLEPWYVRYNQLLAIGVSVAGLLLTLMGMLLQGR